MGLDEPGLPWISGLPDTLLSFRKSIEYEELLRQMCSADALLIIDAPFDKKGFFSQASWWTISGGWRPILALTPPGTSAEIVAAAGGLVASPESSETIAAGLVNMIQRLRSGFIGAPTEDVVARYDAADRGSLRSGRERAAAGGYACQRRGWHRLISGTH